MNRRATGRSSAAGQAVLSPQQAPYPALGGRRPSAPARGRPLRALQTDTLETNTLGGPPRAWRRRVRGRCARADAAGVRDLTDEELLALLAPDRVVAR